MPPAKRQRLQASWAKTFARLAVTDEAQFTAVAGYTRSDPDGDSVSWLALSGSDAASFA